METVKLGGGDEGPVGHGAVAHDLLNKAAKVIEEDAAEDVKKTKEGLPWWVYLIVLAILIGCAAAMLILRSEKEPKDEKKGLLLRGATMLACHEARIMPWALAEFVGIPDSQAAAKA